MSEERLSWREKLKRDIRLYDYDTDEIIKEIMRMTDDEGVKRLCKERLSVSPVRKRRHAD